MGNHPAAPRLETWCSCGHDAPPDFRRDPGSGMVARSQEASSNAKLLRGARDGDPGAVRQALDVGANTETRQPLRGALGSPTAGEDTPRLPGRVATGLTPLMHAARGGHLTCVMALLDARAAVDAEDEEGLTALHYAAAAGDLDVFKALVLSCGDGLLYDRRGRLPLDLLPEAIVSQHPGEVRRWEAVMRNELPPPPV
mmetsp:Transcript_74654/g.206758  ORF Transcript_74654/g.206758 Transcript_74654/m.206758 type:complete len:198 (+) Transcript_74654:43-636(+)